MVDAPPMPPIDPRAFPEGDANPPAPLDAEDENWWLYAAHRFWARWRREVVLETAQSALAGRLEKFVWLSPMMAMTDAQKQIVVRCLKEAAAAYAERTEIKS